MIQMFSAIQPFKLVDWQLFKELSLNQKNNKKRVKMNTSKISLLWLMVAAMCLQIATAKWCTKMGSRAYKSENATKYITKIEKYCCDGYSHNGTDCNPICPQNCPNGICVQPNKCVCNGGYKLQPLKNICEPFCSIPCGFGKCTKPETCECNANHAFNSTSKKCEPVCVPQCPAKSKCTRPNHCECEWGYKFNQTSELCDPICQNECINAFCAAPETCECFKGYSKDSPTFHVCRANHCTRPCYLGYCDTNGECHCPDGYTKSIFTSNGNTHCETIAVSSLQYLGIILAVVLTFSIIIVIVVKLLVKKGTYEPKKTEDEFKKKISVK